MFELGKKIGAELIAGDLILLNGPLGAGKTLLTQGIGGALGITGITSPTFVISRVHQADLPLIHVDAYRLLQSESPELSLDDLDLDSERESAVTVIEWGGQTAARLSDERLEITIDRSDITASGNERRIVTALSFGLRWENFTL